MSVPAAVVSLRREWIRVAAIGFGGIVLAGLIEPRWLPGAAIIWAYCLWLVRRGLEDNRGAGEESLFASFGWPTLVTLGRGALLACVAGFVFVPMPSSAPAVLYTAAVLLDHVDGRLARSLGRTTRLGERLDMEIDAAGILIASLLAVLYGKVPAWYLVIGLGRYLFVLGILWRRRRGLPVVELDTNPLRRWLAGTQMGFLAVALWPVVPPALTHFAAPLFAGVTLAMFVRDWRFVSCRILPSA